MQTPELSDDDDFSNYVFYGTFEDFHAMREAKTPHTQTRNIQEADKPDYSITTKHRPRKELVMQIQENIAVEQILSTETQTIYSCTQELKTTIAYVDYGQTIQIIKNTNPNFTCAYVERNDNNNFDDNNAQHKIYQCENCEKFFYQISEYRKHLVDVAIHVCNSCGKRFTNYGKYSLHCLGHGNPERECSGCGKVLANKYTLKKHMFVCKKMQTRKLREFRKPPKTASN